MFDVVSSVPSVLASARDRVLGFLPGFASWRFCMRARRAFEVPGPRSAGIGVGFSVHGSSGAVGTWLAVGFGSHAAVHRTVPSGLRGRWRLPDPPVVYGGVESFRRTSAATQRRHG